MKSTLLILTWTYSYSCISGQDCSAGTYHDQPSGDCLPCPRGQFSTFRNALQCLSCDKYHHTAQTGSYSEDDCKPVCGLGGVYPEYCQNGGTCTWQFGIARCSCEDPFTGETCSERMEPKSDTDMILIAVFCGFGGIFAIVMIILCIRLHYVKKEKKEAHEDRKKAILARAQSDDHTHYNGYI